MSRLNEDISRINEKLQLLLKNYHALQKENARLKHDLEQKKAVEKEMSENKVWVRRQGRGDMGAKNPAEFIAMVQEEIGERKAE